MYPLKINGAGNKISRAMSMYVTAKVGESGAKIHMHPIQFSHVCELYGTVSLLSDKDTVKKEYPPTTFCGLDIVQDAEMPADVVQWRDKAGALLAKITGLAT